MFIKTELIKKFKEEVFKEKLQNKLNPFLNFTPGDNIQDEIKDNVEIFNDKSTPFSSNSKRHEMYNLLMDIRFAHSESYEFVSELGQDLSLTQKVADTKVQRMFANSTEITKTVALHLMRLSKNSVLVGGCVRDAILSLPSNDIDFATDAHFDDVQAEMEKAGFKIKETGKQFLVMIVSKENSEGVTEDFEIAMFRKDSKTSADGRRPDSVEIGTLLEDSNRRDFGINSLSFNLFTEKVQDPNGTGLKDLEDMVLRFVGNPDERIKEDFLRVARFFRFLGRFKDLGMRPDSRSLKACRTNFPEMQNKVAPERLRMEIEKMVGL